MVAGARGIGKTYGVRKHATGDALNKDYRFVEICRYKSELRPVMDGYFDKISDEFPGWIFKTEGGKGYAAREPKGKNKPKWKTICYFVALTDAQNAKKRTYKNVRTLIFDEAILERTDRFHDYIPNEYSRLANIVDTTTRERPDSNFRPHLYLLGNACDLLNPYFQAYGINKVPDFGYHWYRNKTVILHYVDPGDYATQKLDGTVSGRMTAGTKEGEVAAYNQFIVGGTDLIEQKTKNAKCECVFHFDGKRLGLWFDYKEGKIFINNKTTSDADAYYITRDDATVNALAANRALPVIKALKEAHYTGAIRYSSFAVRNDFLDMMSRFGIPT